ncbi:Glyoxylase, beta-lactamase superfamily II [Paenibacillus sp. UNC496MF]|uniref:MBL fold metallo-hydrolase n=1 Tax=Paenibacillus sp. UNC496MF TaxID=1502753 RepID=UPI0008E22F2A|nr:MBL fold metallo-hydrolase [Paenibacillus sp. UNC496MF]SFI76177.1 Glyoxylase, beta-lactamase superfamily II [Paenibacillus sp. UNC496MF]
MSKETEYPPHAVRLAEGFYAVAGDKLTHPWDASAYLFTGDEPVLVDCGSAEGYPALKRNLASLGVRPQDIRAVYATHGHWDHLSGFARLRAESGAKLYVHELDRRQVETGDPERTGAFLYGRPFPPAAADGLLREGDALPAGRYRLEVIHTPGHTPGSVSFLFDAAPGPVLIAGDALWGGYHPKVGSDLDDWQASLDKLLARRFELMTFGHLPPTLAYDAHAKVGEARRQLGTYMNPWFKPFHERFRY